MKKWVKLSTISLVALGLLVGVNHQQPTTVQASGTQSILAQPATSTFTDQDVSALVGNVQKIDPEQFPIIRRQLANVIYSFLFERQTVQQLTASLNQLGLGSISSLFANGDTQKNVSPQYVKPNAALEAFVKTVPDWFNNVQKEDWYMPFDDASGSGKLHAYYIANPVKTNKTVIAVHGYDNSGEGFAYMAKMFYEMGYNVLLPDQRDHGLSDGKEVDFGYRAPEDLSNWAKRVDQTVGTDSQITLYGLSMGAGSVTQAAGASQLPSSVKGVIDDCSYSSMSDLLSDKVNQLVASVESAPIGQDAIKQVVNLLNPTALLHDVDLQLQAKQQVTLAEISPKAQLAKSKLPLLVIHTLDDQLIPYEESVANYNASDATNKQFWLLDGKLDGHASASRDFFDYQNKLKQFTTEVFSGQSIDTNVQTFRDQLAQAQMINRSLYDDQTLTQYDALLFDLNSKAAQANLSDADYQAMQTELASAKQLLKVNPLTMGTDGIALTSANRLNQNTVSGFDTSNKNTTTNYWVNVPMGNYYDVTIDYTAGNGIVLPGTTYTDALQLNQLRTSYGSVTGQTLKTFGVPATFGKTLTIHDRVYLKGGPQVLQFKQLTDQVRLKGLKLQMASAPRHLSHQIGQVTVINADQFDQASDNGYYAIENHTISYTNRANGQYLYGFDQVQPGTYQVQLNYATPNWFANAQFDLVKNPTTMTNIGQISLDKNNILGQYGNVTLSKALRFTVTQNDIDGGRIALRMTLTGTAANVQSLAIVRIN